jgi:pyruvate ferredoxin oxidoreductase alpha subunit
MVILDAFVLSHTYEPVDIPDQDKVDAFLPKKLYKYRLDIKEPHAFHCLTPPDVYFELRYKLQKAMDEAIKVINDVGEEYGRIFGRQYGLVEKYHTEDAELILVASGTSVSTARVVIDQLREKGESVGMLKIRTFRPFPVEEVQEVLSKAKKVAVMDRNISYGHGGIFSQEIKASLYHLSEDKKPEIYGYIVGLGGRDITPDVITNIIRRTQKEDKSKEIIIWEGLK